ncbi:hypothetical protein Tco_1128948 [Tanacetum coccineum]
MRNKKGIDELDIDDLYNNLKVFEANIKGSSGSSSNSQNVAFLSAEDTNSINEVNTANGVSTAAGYSSNGVSTVVSPTPTTRVYSIHPKAQIIGDPKSAVQTRGMTKKNSGEHAMISYIQKQRRTNYKDF